MREVKKNTEERSLGRSDERFARFALLCKLARTGNYGGTYEFVWNAKSHETVGNAKLAHLRTLAPSIIRITFEWYAKNFSYLCECRDSIRDIIFGNKRRKSIGYLRCYRENVASTIVLLSRSIFLPPSRVSRNVRVGATNHYSPFYLRIFLPGTIESVRHERGTEVRH